LFHRRCFMSLSPNAISPPAQISRQSTTQTYLAFPLILMCVALILILVSAVFSPVTLATVGAEGFLLGP
jgi:hypothetical protein